MLWLDYYWHKVLKRPYTLFRRIDKGRGQPVVFLHGIASSGENWRQLANMFDENKYRIIVFDLLGFGDSPQPDWLEYSVEDHAEAVVASLKRLRIRKPIVLVGHSMGSLVAAHIARQYPKRVAHVVLYQAPIYARLPELKTKDLKRQAYLSVFRYLADHPNITLWYAKVLGKTASRLAGFFLDERTWQPFEMSLKNTIMQQQSYEDLRSLKMPVDVIYGRYDIFVLKKNLQYYFRPSKHVRFFEIDELHRISSRTNELLKELIMQDPKIEPQITSGHARLIDMSKVEELEKNPKKQQSSRSTYWHVGLAAGLLSAVSILFALQSPLPAWELAFFHQVNGWDAPAFIGVLARISSDIVWLAVILVALALFTKKYFKAAYRITVPAVIAYGFAYIVEHVIGRARPDVLLGSEFVERATQTGAGFPSGHVTAFVVIVFVLWPYLSKPLQFVAVILTLLVGWSRMFLGVHFPLDVIGALTIALFVFCMLQLLPHSFRKRIRLED